MVKFTDWKGTQMNKYTDFTITSKDGHRKRIENTIKARKLENGIDDKSDSPITNWKTDYFTNASLDRLEKRLGIKPIHYEYAVFCILGIFTIGIILLFSGAFDSLLEVR